LTMTDEEVERLTALSRSRNRAGEPGIAGADAAGLSRESFVLCGGAKSWGSPSDGFSAALERALAYWAAGRRSRIGHDRAKKPVITPEAKSLVGVRWRATRPRSTAIRMNCGRRGLLARPRSRGTDRRWGHESLAQAGFKATVCKDPRPGGNQAAQGALLSGNVAMAEFRAEDGRRFCAFIARVQVLKRAAAKSRKAIKRVTIVSYGRKSRESRPSQRRQPILPPKPGVHASLCAGITSINVHGTLSLLAGIDLPYPGRSHALVRGTATRSRWSSSNSSSVSTRSAYPASTAIKLILDKSFRAHIERNKSLARRSNRPGRLRVYLLRPSMVRGSISSRASSPNSPGRSCAHIRVTSKHETQRAHYGRPSTTSIAIPSSIQSRHHILGPTSSPRLPDMIRNMKTLT